MRGPFTREAVEALIRAQGGVRDGGRPGERCVCVETFGLWCRMVLSLGSRAEKDLTELLALDPAGRAVRVRRARLRFRNPLLAEALLDEARRCLGGRGGDPGMAYELAELAREVAFRLRRRTFGVSLVREINLRACCLQLEALADSGEVEEARLLLAFCLERITPETSPRAAAAVARAAALVCRPRGRR